MDELPSGMLAAIMIPIVGRQRELERIRKALEVRETKIFYITGPGGIGKTRLIQEILKEFSQREDCAVAKEPIDLYHPANRSLEGLLEAIKNAMGLELNRYQEVKEEINRLLLQTGATFSEVEKKRRDMAEAFIKDWEEESAERRLVIAFDTLEKLHYESDRFQELLKVEIEYPVVRSWLFREFLPKASNSLILLAGRPRETLAQELRGTLGNKLEEIELRAFSEEETCAYFANIINQLPEHSLERQRLERLSMEIIKRVHSLTSGRPIFISLVADYLATADLLLPIFRAPIEMPTVDETVRNEVERALVGQIMDLPDPLRNTTYYLAWARRGMEPELLAKLMDISEEEAQNYINEARRLSFVKTRPGDRKAFLHDEMYELVEKHLLSSQSPDEHRRIYSICINYFQKKIQSHQEELQNLYQTGQIDSKLAEIKRALIEAKVNLVHYMLIDNPLEGFSLYFKFSEESYHGSDVETDMLLREEILDFLALKFAGGEEEVNGLKKSEIETEMATRWVKRLINLGRFNEALEVAEKIESNVPNLEKIFPYLWADLLISKAFIKIMTWKELKEAEDLLREAIEILEKGKNGEFVYVLLAKAYNYLGYLYRVQGQYKGAIKSYNKAMVYQRYLKLEAQQAETLNNSAFALAEAGEPHTAIAQAKDALELRFKLGFPYPIGLSYNTLALVEIRHSDYERAKIYAEEARNLFERIRNQRGVGLSYLALAEALLRLSAKPALKPEEVDLESRIKLLKMAEKYAREALKIFRGIYLEEEREVEALLRLGCVCRDQARLLRGAEESKGKAKEAYERFKEVVDRTKEKMSYRAVEAIVDE
ncbi:MAG: AAA family ATPase, partial [Candidatus Bathyarchaeia archaeon]